MKLENVKPAPGNFFFEGVVVDQPGNSTNVRVA